MGNNREFDSLSKEIEYQDLEIQLAEKRINEYKAKIAQKNEVIDATKEKLAKEEELLIQKSKEFGESLDEHLYAAYNRIRTKVKNGLAVVAIERGASGGSYFTIPPQVQLEIAN